jgi:hypothetical protein
MWKIDVSRSKFRQKYPYEEVPTGPLVTEILGNPVEQGPGQGNYEELDRLIGMFKRCAGSNSSSDVYAGLTPKMTDSDGAKKDAVHSWRYKKQDDAAWIAIDLRYLEMAAATADAAVDFPRIVRLTNEEVDPSVGQEALDVIRESVFRHVGKDYPGDHHYYVRRDFTRARQDPEWLDQTKAAVFFAMAHELDHLLRKDLDKRPSREDKAKLAWSQNAVGPVWPWKRPHQDEFLADHEAVKFVATAADEAGFTLGTVISGSFVCLTTAALDGWFMDGSATSDTHPSAFARAYSLLAVWVSFLASQNKQGWPDSRQPTADELLKVAYSFLSVDWVGGLYRRGREDMEGREGLVGIGEDLCRIHDLLCEASGLTDPFRVYS